MAKTLKDKEPQDGDIIDISVESIVKIIATDKDGSYMVSGEQYDVHPNIAELLVSKGFAKRKE